MTATVVRARFVFTALLVGRAPRAHAQLWGAKLALAWGAAVALVLLPAAALPPAGHGGSGATLLDGALALFVAVLARPMAFAWLAAQGWLTLHWAHEVRSLFARHSLARLFLRAVDLAVRTRTSSKRRTWKRTCRTFERPN